jgi:hypothetical protein
LRKATGKAVRRRAGARRSYKAALLGHLFLTGDYQFVQNPAYKRGHSPVHVFGLRLHAEY